MIYLDFLKTKVEVAPVSGFDVPPEEISPALKPHQKDAVRSTGEEGRCSKASVSARPCRSWNTAARYCGMRAARR